jgi:hypothetical protein
MVESVLKTAREVKGKIRKSTIPASARHFSGYFFAYSSCARANFGHENGVTLPST